MLYTILALVWLHFLADFILQTDKMAVNKAGSLAWLGLHVGVYTACFLFMGIYFALVNGALHFLVDFVTSKCTRHFNAKGDKRKFFMTIGFDQALHLSALLLTVRLLG